MTRSSIKCTVELHVGHGIFHTWYKIVGDIKHGKTRPVVALHGGPGLPHNYILPHIDLYTSRGIPVIFYDQIGCGQSTHLPNRGKEFWTYNLFMDELENLLVSLNIDGNYDLLGHSWGGMLAAMFALRRKPKGLKHLALIGTPASMALWIAETDKLLGRFPKEFQDMMRRHEAEKTTEDKEYQDGMYTFYRKHVCTCDPWPQDLLDAVALSREDGTVYDIMNGPSEFCISGTIKTWTVVDKLTDLKYPTLITNGVDDEAQDAVVLPFFRKAPQVKWVQFVQATHQPFWEDRERDMNVVAEFLTTV